MKTVHHLHITKTSGKKRIYKTLKHGKNMSISMLEKLPNSEQKVENVIKKMKKVKKKMTKLGMKLKSKQICFLRSQLTLSKWR